VNMLLSVSSFSQSSRKASARRKESSDGSYTFLVNFVSLIVASIIIIIIIILLLLLFLLLSLS
jgi:hypothetical protein